MLITLLRGEAASGVIECCMVGRRGVLVGFGRGLSGGPFWGFLVGLLPPPLAFRAARAAAVRVLPILGAILVGVWTSSVERVPRFISTFVTRK